VRDANYPVKLDLNSIQRSIDKTLRYVYIAPAVRDAARLLYNDKVVAAINGVDPTIIKTAIKPWLDRTVQQRISMPGHNATFDAAVNSVRSSIARSRLAYSMYAWTQDARIQPRIAGAAGWGNTLKADARYFVNAAAHLFGGSNDMAKETANASAFMKDRLLRETAEAKTRINKILTTGDKMEGLREYIDENAGLMSHAARQAIDVVTWNANYNKALESGLSHDEAVYAGDSAVRTIVGSQAPEDISAYETGTPIAKLFTSAVGWRNVWLNDSMMRWAQANGGIKKFGMLMNTIIMPMFVGAALRYIMGGNYNSEDAHHDGIVEDFTKEFLEYVPSELASFVPAGAGVVRAGIRLATKDPNDPTIHLSMPLDVFEHALRGAVVGPAAGYKAWRDHKVMDSKDIVDVSTLLDMLTGYPFEPFGRALGYQTAVSAGKARPSSTVDYIRGLATGDKGKK
jgi:hypothetical protein